MNLFFQVLTRSQSGATLQLLRFPSIFSRTSQCAGNGKVAAGGKISSFKFGTTEELIAKALRNKFNELGAEFSSTSFDVGRLGFAVVSARGVLKPAVSSNSWFPSREWPPGGDRAARNRKMNAKAAEMGLDYYKIGQEPSLLEAVFEVATERTQGEVLNTVAKCLVSQMPQALRQIQPFGCCDIGGVEFNVRFETDFVTTESIRIMAHVMPSAYPQLGLRFDKLHALMFGNVETCRGIASAIGPHANLILASTEEPPAAVLLKPVCNLTQATKRASTWLLAPRGS